MMRTPETTLAWLLDQLDITREWADHAADCDTCDLDLGFEYGGASKCNDYRWDHHEVTHGPITRAAHDLGERLLAAWGSRLTPAPFIRHTTHTLGDMTINVIKDEPGDDS